MEVLTSVSSKMLQENVLGSVYKRKIISSLYSLFMQVVSLLQVSEKPLVINVHHQSNSSLLPDSTTPRLFLLFFLFVFYRVPLEDILVMTSRC